MSLINESQQFQISQQRRMPVDNVGTDALTVIVEPLPIPFKYYNAGVLTVDAGQVAGALVVAKLTYRNIKNSLGDVTGTHQDTSLTFTSTAFTTIKDFPYTVAEEFDTSTSLLKAQAITEGFVNGEYCIDHMSGTLYGIKASNQTSLTAVTYKVETSTSGSGGGVSSDINIVKLAGVPITGSLPVISDAYLVSVLETLQELIQRIAPLAGAMNSGATSLRVTPIASVSTAVTGPITNAQFVAATLTTKISDENQVAILSNVNNTVGK